VIDWSFPPDIQAQYDRVLADVRRLQAEMGIKPMTLEERAAAYEYRQQEEKRRQEELEKLQKITGQRRPPPKWKV
jgi:hypothetical protein